MQPVAPIEAQAPVPSIMTTARDRSRDGFGTQADAPPDLPDVEPAPARASWRTGIEWEDFSCSTGSAWPQCQTDDDAVKAFTPGTGAVASSPFWMTVGLTCDFRLDESELNTAAERALAARGAYLLARALWLGEGLPDAEPLATSPARKQPTLRRSGSAVSMEVFDFDDAVTLLLAAYEAATGGLGGAVLHVPSVLIPAALGGTPGGSVIARVEGQIYRGPLGSVLSPGPGYPYGRSADGGGGYGPLVDPDSPSEEYLGSENDEAWIYVSGPVEYALGDVLPPHQVTSGELRRNEQNALAERQAIFRFDPCPVRAALVSLPAVLPEVS